MAVALRAESLVSLVAALLAYGTLVGDWKTFLLFFLLPDVSIFFFLFGPIVGSLAYNVAHNTILPTILLCASFLVGQTPSGIMGSLIWLAHVHFDRTLGYGLKRHGSFRETHLGTIGSARKQ